MALDVETVARQLAGSGIVSPGKLEHFVPPKAHPASADELVAALVKLPNLTPLQAAQIMAGILELMRRRHRCDLQISRYLHAKSRPIHGRMKAGHRVIGGAGVPVGAQTRLGVYNRRILLLNSAELYLNLGVRLNISFDVYAEMDRGIDESLDSFDGASLSLAGVFSH